MEKTKESVSEKRSAKEIINHWRAQSKIGKAHRILSTVLPLAGLAIIVIASAFHWLGALMNSITSGTAITEAVVADWLMLLVNIIPLALVAGFTNGLLLIFSRINFGNYIITNKINIRKAIKNEKATKQDEYDISVATLAAERKGTRALLFVRHGIWFILQLIEVPIIYIVMQIVCDTMLGNTSIIQALFSSSILIVLVIVTIINFIITTVFDSVIKNKAKDNLYSRE